MVKSRNFFHLIQSQLVASSTGGSSTGNFSSKELSLAFYLINFASIGLLWSIFSRIIYNICLGRRTGQHRLSRSWTGLSSRKIMKFTLPILDDLQVPNHSECFLTTRKLHFPCSIAITTPRLPFFRHANWYTPYNRIFCWRLSYERFELLQGWSDG